jgi:hypothetical protein
LDTDRRGVATGRFVYGKSYLARANAVPVDPVELKLANRVYETRALKGVFGAIRDTSPDYWGRRIIEKYAGLGALSELDYLLHSPDDRAGALAFAPGALVTQPIAYVDRAPASSYTGMDGGGVIISWNASGEMMKPARRETSHFARSSTVDQSAAAEKRMDGSGISPTARPVVPGTAGSV